MPVRRLRVASHDPNAKRRGLLAGARIGTKSGPVKKTRRRRTAAKFRES
jgi:hypothetical protein